ncbi:MAG: hypothetical protein QOG85_1799 [Gaiellaceae bacterium]|jgi:hypothetical protein|nr:hypothetical protein [Gaiellaceae bacterium]
MKTFVAVAAVATAASAGIHFAVAPEHFHEWWGFGTFFVACGVAQLVWAAFPSSAVIGIGGNAALIALWAFSRTTGLPFGPEAGMPEAMGPLDVASVLLEGAAVVALVWNRVAASAQSIPFPHIQEENACFARARATSR